MFNEKNLGIYFPSETEMVAENDWTWNPIYVWFCKIWDVEKTDKPKRKIFKLDYDWNGWIIKKKYASSEFNKIRDDRVSYF